MALVVGGGIYLFTRKPAPAQTPTPVAVVSPQVASTATPTPAETPTEVVTATPTPEVVVETPEESPTPGEAGEMQLSGTGLKKEVVCHGEKIILNGLNNQLKLKGSVTSLDINGSDNRIDVENAAEIHIQGAHNQIRWSGIKPKVVSAGADNKISKRP